MGRVDDVGTSMCDLRQPAAFGGIESIRGFGIAVVSSGWLMLWLALSSPVCAGVPEYVSDTVIRIRGICTTYTNSETILRG